MKGGSIIRWLALGTLVAAFIAPAVSVPRLTWSASFSMAGLVLDILGAILLSWSFVKQPADEIASAPWMFLWGRKPRVWRDPFLIVAMRLGSPFLTRLSHHALEDFEDALSGLVLLGLGFLGQAVGQLLNILAAW